MYRWGVRQGCLPEGFTPFATLEPTRPPVKALLETDLPTAGEVRSILAHATPALADLLRVQYATGARSGELRAADAGDYQPATRQIVLRHHKRERTMRDPRPRVIVLNADADAIVKRRCEGRPLDAPLFTTPTGRRWSDKMLSYHFTQARADAGARPIITPYALRHVWISEALMAGVDVLLVARMAGTSVAMIERVYGHFRNQSYQDAQARLDRERAARGL
jgi:integrase